ncbi:MAG: hypothetical protein MJ252_08325 [archaeon]|nr:hypothetical protein [archaeon]
MDKDKTKTKTTAKDTKETKDTKTAKDTKDAKSSKLPTEEAVKTETSANKSPQQSPRVTNIKPIRINFSVPSNLLERIDFINKIFTSEDLMYKNSNAPEINSAPIEEIGKYFSVEYNEYPNILGAILFYISTNFTIDQEAYEQSKPKNQDLQSVIKTKKGASEGICNLFIAICKSIGVNCEIITGKIKRKGYVKGQSLHNHHWIALNVGKIYLIDPSLFMGDCSGNEKIFHPFYFLTPPELLLDSHKPDDDRYQFADNPIELKKFVLNPMVDYETFYYNVFKNKVILISHMKPIINCTYSEMDLKYNVESSICSANVFLKGKPYDPKNYKVQYNDIEKYYNLHIVFSGDGEYEIALTSRLTSTTDDTPLNEVLRYKVKATVIHIIKPPLKKVLNLKIRQTSVGEKDLSKKRGVSEKRKMTKSASDFEERKKKKCYDNKNAHLYEPKAEFLKVGLNTKFKVKIRGAKSVIVLDGTHWNYLKRREDDIYEGNVVIQSSNVAICMLKTGGVMTEVFEFYAIKRETGVVAK